MSSRTSACSQLPHSPFPFCSFLVPLNAGFRAWPWPPGMLKRRLASSDLVPALGLVMPPLHGVPCLPLHASCLQDPPSLRQKPLGCVTALVLTRKEGSSDIRGVCVFRNLFLHFPKPPLHGLGKLKLPLGLCVTPAFVPVMPGITLLSPEPCSERGPTNSETRWPRLQSW